MKDPNQSKSSLKDPFTTRSMSKPNTKSRSASTVDKISTLSTEFIVESDDDKDTESRTNSTVESSITNGTKSISPSSPFPGPTPLGARAKASGKKRPSSPDGAVNISRSSKIDVSRGSSSESESGYDTEESKSRDAEKSSRSPQNIPRLIPAYKPPNGFGRAKITLPSSSTLSTLFPVADSSNRQLWHITVPATIPINEIQKTSMPNLLKTEAIVSHKGSYYGFVEDPRSGQDKKHILIPNAQESQYQSISANVDRTLHLRHLVQLPNLTNTTGRRGDGPQESLALPRTHRKFVRQQPEGLRMRYRPFGDTEQEPEGNASDNSIADDGENSKAQFRPPLGFEKMNVDPISRDEDGRTAKKWRKKELPTSIRNGNMKGPVNTADPSSTAQAEDLQKSPADGDFMRELSIAKGTADDSRQNGTKIHKNRTSEARTAQKEEKRRRKEQERTGEDQVEHNMETLRKKRKRHQEQVVGV
ncbi:MAG: hypothetical protein Q9187_000277 [Circinaria calcarea]